jgi:hypothetical protein
MQLLASATTAAMRVGVLRDDLTAADQGMTEGQGGAL